MPKRRKKTVGESAGWTRTLLINTVYSVPDSPELYVRVREVVTRGGSSAVLTVKRKVSGSPFEEERETAVEDAAQAMHALEMMGCVRSYVNEKLRDVLAIPGMGELDFDHYPGLPPCLEVECPSRAQLDALMRALGLKASQAVRAELGAMYEDAYGVPDKGRDKSGDLTFAHPSNIPGHVARDKRAEFRKLLAHQKAVAASMLKAQAAAAAPRKKAAT